MKNKEFGEKALHSLNNTITNCDNKAVALLMAVGVVFGFSLFSVPELSNKEGLGRVLLYIFGSLYLLSFASSIITLVMIVFPRKRNKSEIRNQKDYPFYSEDLYSHLNKGDIGEFVDGGADNDSLLEQIKICSRIAHTKEKLLIVSVITIIAFVLSLLALIVCFFLS